MREKTDRDWNVKLFVRAVLLAAFMALPSATPAATFLTENGWTHYVIVVDPKASAPELFAAGELAAQLRQITGAEFVIQTNTKPASRAILVGDGEAARSVFREVPFDKLEPEELVIETKGRRLLLAGGRPRGTLYAVSRFLQDDCNVRWWTPWASRVPKVRTLRIGSLNVRTKPAFEYREPYWYPAFNAPWSWRNGVNGQSSQLAPEQGGRITYKGFVHTFYSLVPPEKYFGEHPEWFSLVKGARTTNRAQLCLTNPKLRDFMVERVREWLRAAPDAGIISVSQNDWFGACECPDCKAMDDAEGTHAATMVSLVNYIAEKIEPEFPHVAIDTLAYQYTRKPPKTIRPRTNVIVRLCSIECNFRESLGHASNVAFAEDIVGWAKLCQRLYIWDYTTDFAHYVQPHPNWFALDANIRFFATNGVKGVFSEGAYQSHGSEMAELRAWVLAQLLWNPRQDGRALVQEFLDGYYGTAAAPYLRKYLEEIYAASSGYVLTCYSGPDAPFLRFKPLARAEELWQQAEAAAAGSPEYLERIRLGHLAVRGVWLSRWDRLQKECTDAGAVWPFSQSRKEMAEEWRAVANGVPGKPWTRVTLMSEGGLTPEKFLNLNF